MTQFIIQSNRGRSALMMLYNNLSTMKRLKLDEANLAFYFDIYSNNNAS